MAGRKPTRARARPRARAVAVSAPPRATPGRLELARFAPSGPSILTGFLILAAAAGAYALARGTSAFAVQSVAVQGAPAHVAADVRTALAGAQGQSLLALDLAQLRRRVESVPTVATVRFDRAFPHTLTAVVVPERPVAVLRRGPDSWLVAASGQVLTELRKGDRAGLPRIWLSRRTEIEVGTPVAGDARAAVYAVVPLVRRPLPRRVTAVRASGAELTLVLRSGLELRLGDRSDRALKLEIARRILAVAGTSTGYLDVSVPQRPVLGSTLDSQVEVQP